MSGDPPSESGRFRTIGSSVAKPSAEQGLALQMPRDIVEALAIARDDRPGRKIHRRRILERQGRRTDLFDPQLGSRDRIEARARPRRRRARASTQHRTRYDRQDRAAQN